MFPSGSPDITLEFNPQSVLAAIAKVNKALGEMDKGVPGAAKRASEAVDSMAQKMISQSSRIEQQQNRMVKSLEMTAAAYGRSGEAKLLAQRDQLLKQFPRMEDANARQVQQINRITAAYSQMIAVEQKAAATASSATSGGSGSGFSARYAIFGLKDIAEGRGKFAVAELVNELTRLGGTTAIIGGVAAGVVGIGFGAIEARKHMEELRAEPALLRAEFARLGQETAISNQELKVAGDRIQQQIDKLEHRPTNGVAFAMDEATLASERLGQSMERSLKGYLDLMKTSEHGTLSQVFFRTTNDKDIAELIGGKNGTGFGGLVGEINKVTNAGGNPSSVLTNYRGQFQHLLEISENNQNFQQGRAYRRDLGPVEATADQGARIEKLGAIISEIASLQKAYAMETRNAGLEQRRGALQDIAGGQGLADRIGERRGQIEEARGAGVGDLGALAAAYRTLNEDRAKGVALAAEDGKFGNAALNTLDAILYRQKEVNDLHKIDLEQRKQQQEIDRVLGEAPTIQSGFMSPLGTGKTLNSSEYLRESSEWRERNANLFGGSTIAPGGFISPQEQLRDAQNSARAGLGLAGTQLKLSGASEPDQINAIAELKKGYADQEYNALKRIADAKSDSVERELAQQDAKDRKDQQYFDADVSRQQDLAQLQVKQYEEIKSKASQLFETLFTHPSKFGKDLISTVHQAAIQPAVEMLSTGTARLLQPLFGGHGANSNPVVASTDSNTSATNANTTALYAHAAMVGGGSTGLLAGPASGGWSGGGGVISVPTPFGSIPIPMFGRGRGGGWTGGGGGGWTGGGGGVFSSSAPGGTSGFAGPVSSARGDASGGGITSGPGGALGAFGIGGGRLGSAIRDVGGMGGLKAAAGFGDVDGGYSQIGDWSVQVGNLGGDLTAFGLSPLGRMATGTGGSIAANWGLIGGGRGSAAGVAAGTLGGAGIGASIGAAGGPPGMLLGAGIGALAGLGAGLGEVLAGVEPQWREAERLVKSTFGININRQEANMLVSLANSKYGGQVSVAVRSPEARESLGLYSAGTGQARNFPQSADLPHGASLVEQGGRLSQQATYQFGNAYVQNSNLPIAPGSQGAQVLPSPGTTMVSLNISGANTANFLTGNYVTPDFVSNQYSAALSNSNGRTSNSMMFDEPGSIVS